MRRTLYAGGLVLAALGTAGTATAATPAPPAITGVVFDDADRDGRKDRGERLRSGVTVDLLKVRAGKGVKVRSTRTALRTGRFRLTIRTGGTYRARVRPPKGFVASKTSQSRTLVVSRTRRAGLKVDFGLRPATVVTPPPLPPLPPPATPPAVPPPPPPPPPAVVPPPPPPPPARTVAGRVWADADGDGLLDVGEVGRSGVVLELFSADKATALAETTTGADGTYALTVPAGTTQVRVKLTPAAGTLLSGSSTGAMPVTDSDFAVFGADRTFTPVIDAAASVTGVDGALGTAGSIRGRLFIDEDADGRFDGADATFTGPVELWSRNGERLLDTTTSTAVAGYRFDVAAGTASGYRIKFIQPNEGRHTLKNVGLPATNSDAIYSGPLRGFSDVIFPPLATPDVLAIDSGFQRPISLTGIKLFVDSNADGNQDPGEDLSGAVQIELWDAAKTQLLDSESINPDGITLTAPGPGLYRVKFPRGAGRFTLKDVGSNLTDSDVNRSGLDEGYTDPVPLTAGQPGPANIDGGRLRPIPISGIVFRDADSDGLEDDADAGVPGAIMQLLDAGGDVVDETTTGADGVHVLFAPEAGSYRVRIVPPPGDTLTAQDAPGTNSTNDSDFDPITRTTDVIVAANGNSFTNVDVGLLP